VYARLQAVISTCRKQGRDVFLTLRDLFAHSRSPCLQRVGSYEQSHNIFYNLKFAGINRMECPHCHHINRDNARFCAGCGNPLAPDAAPTYVALQPGQVLQGQYRIIRTIGKGGMGAVYLVEDQRAFGRLRVIKEMLQYYDLSNPMEVQAALRRFEAEGRTLAQLRHPGIPDIIAYFSEGGRHYIVMEYVEGENLLSKLTHEDIQGNRISGQPYPPPDVLRWGIQLCDVLIYLSEQNPPVVHHDIKPANIIIDRTTGEARLVDFGTAEARLLAQPGGQVGVRQSSIYSTEGYAAPEMYEGKSSPNSDVFSLAATLYHLLTDDDPRYHPFAFPKLNTIEPTLRAILEKALQVDPQQRPNAGALRQALVDAQAVITGEVRAPFTFPDGRMARTPEEVARLCDQHWTAARHLLYNGDFEAWLRRSLFRTDLADQAAKITKTIADQDEGLEAFLHILAPRLPYPALRVRPRVLRFGRIHPGDCAQRVLSIRNRARRGVLKGEIIPDPPVPWLSVPSQFSGEADIPVLVDTKGIPRGTLLTTHLRLRTAYGEEMVTLQGQVAFPWLLALGRIGLATAIGAFVGGVLAFLGTAVPAQPRTLVGIIILSLLLAARRWSSGASWLQKGFRFVRSLVFYGAFLLGANYLGYAVWGWVRDADLLASRTIPIGVGAIFGLALSIPRALGRVGRRAIPRLMSALVLIVSTFYLGWQALQGLMGDSPEQAFPLPLRGTVSLSPSPIRVGISATEPADGIFVGARVEVVTVGKRLNIREFPGLDERIITRVASGVVLEVIGGPRFADGHTWWEVRLPDGTVGWAAEQWLKRK